MRARGQVGTHTRPGQDAPGRPAFGGIALIRARGPGAMWLSARADAGALKVYKRLCDDAARLARFGAFDCELASETLTWTDGVYHLFGLEPGLVLRRSQVVGFYSDESRAEMEAARAEAIRSGDPLTVEARIRTAQGETRWMRLFMQVDQAGAAARRIFGGKQDVTAERETFDRLRHMAERDQLTGLANRYVFEAQLRDGTFEPHATGDPVLVLIDLDHFKLLNDRFGHLAGDACLRETAKRLRRAFPDARLIARLGGDEFGALLPPLPATALETRLTMAQALLCRPMIWAGRRLELGASIGAAAARGQRAAQLFAQADAALYAAKSRGRGTVQIGTGGETTFAAPAPPLAKRATRA